MTLLKYTSNALLTVRVVTTRILQYPREFNPMKPVKEALIAEVSNGYRSLVVVVLSPLAFALVFACWTIFAVLGIELQEALGFGDVAFAVL
ncbi:hypothetical protein DU506_21385, partial [Vreelandella rituensis]